MSLVDGAIATTTMLLNKWELLCDLGGREPQGPEKVREAGLRMVLGPVVQSTEDITNLVGESGGLKIGELHNAGDNAGPERDIGGIEGHGAVSKFEGRLAGYHELGNAREELDNIDPLPGRSIFLIRPLGLLKAYFTWVAISIGTDTNRYGRMY